MSTARRASNTLMTLIAAAVLAASAGIAAAADEPWADDAAVQEVLELRKRGIEAMVSGQMSSETERYSSTFVANTPNNTVVPGTELLKMFESSAISYSHVEQRVDYAGSHGPDMVVIMGEEIVVPGEGATNAGQRIHRRFTDVFRRENGEWRHDLRHANVIAVD
jgi:hypothetical protein